ncbi:MAG TPA: VWA domain-containing protein [Candidatus Limnocylindrales bacterium]|nr:VWA domain-containing protein [Candidatus Limnocylindrales bacterium]
MTAYSPDPRDLGPEAPRRPGVRGRADGRDAAPADSLASRARYAAWDGSQEVADLDADEILDALADDVMAEGDLTEALRRLMERGWRSGDPTRGEMAGLQDLVDRLERRREAMLERYGLGDVLGDIRRELDEIVATERAGVERRLDDASRTGEPGDPGDPGAPDPDSTDQPGSDAALRSMLRDIAARRLDQLDALPPDVGERVRGLQDYDFLEPGAREQFDELVKRLQGQVLDQFVAGMSEAIQSMRPEDLAANREMVRDLNELIRERIGGGEPDVSQFLARHGRFFPGASTFDDIIDQLAQRMAAMQSLLRSMTPAQRAELESMMSALLRDDRLLVDLAQLAANLDLLLPGGLGDRVPFGGDEPLGLEGALAQMARLQAMDRLGDALSDIESPGDLARIDRDEIRELLGDDAASELDALDDLARRLEEAGYLTRDGDRLELTPRGSRRIGQKVLDDLFARLQRDAFGGHRIDRGGRGGEREEATKPYEFGDPFHLDLRGTMFNALAREENAPAVRAASPDRRIHLRASDFEVHRTEQLTQTSTVLLVDMSRSMLLRGCFLAAKKVAVALDTLIRTQYPRDHLSVIGFAYYAREIRPGALAELSWHGYEYGTNLQHGLLLARRILERNPAVNKEIVVITDGEPTAHFENGQVEFNYPPTRRTIQETLREVQRCTKAGITINTFMLERSRALAEFVALMTRLNRGRAFYATPEHLGEYVLVDFVSRRTRKVS